MSDEEQVNLFGEPVPPKPEKPPSYGRRLTEHNRKLLERGLHPTTGVELLGGGGGATCADCTQLYPTGSRKKRFWKCRRARFTHGPKTDVTKGWPACRLFEPVVKVGVISRKTDPEEQEENLERVTAKVGRLVLAFVRDRLAADEPYTADELRAYVLLKDPTLAPASPDRIMRALRQAGQLNYRVENRRQSLYRAVPDA